MKLQKLFEDSVVPTLKQGKRCYDTEYGMCMYTDKEGNHCAVGHLLTKKEQEDTLYITGDATDLFAVFPKIRQRLYKKYEIDGEDDTQVEEFEELLCLLQEWHDNENHWIDPDLGREELEYIKAKFRFKNTKGC